MVNLTQNRVKHEKINKKLENVQGIWMYDKICPPGIDGDGLRD
jgi:hypothetical protein